MNINTATNENRTKREQNQSELFSIHVCINGLTNERRSQVELQSKPQCQLSFKR